MPNTQSGIKSTNIHPAYAARWGFKTMSSVDNPKASKATAFGYLNAILYMAPADTAGVGNLCGFEGACKDFCLGAHSGQAAIGAPETNGTIRARKARAVAFMKNRAEFMAYVGLDIQRLRKVSKRLGLKLCYRFNGSTDIGYGVFRSLVEMYPDVLFIDYTKNPNKMAAYLRGDFAPNYHVTFSRDNDAQERLCERFVSQGGNCTVVVSAQVHAAAMNDGVFMLGGTQFPVVDGDKHDLRCPELDGTGKVVVLTAKGHKAKRSVSAFIVR